jgi:hypothetical protein
MTTFRGDPGPHPQLPDNPADPRPGLPPRLRAIDVERSLARPHIDHAPVHRPGGCRSRRMVRSGLAAEGGALPAASAIQIILTA